MYSAKMAPFPHRFQIRGERTDCRKTSVLGEARSRSPRSGEELDPRWFIREDFESDSIAGLDGSGAASAHYLLASLPPKDLGAPHPGYRDDSPSTSARPRVDQLRPLAG